MPSRKMTAKPLLTQAMKGRNWMVEDWKKVMFSDKSHFELTLGTSPAGAGGRMARTGWPQVHKEVHEVPTNADDLGLHQL